MGAPKAELIVAGRRLLDRAATALLDGGCDPVIVVVRDGTTVGDRVRAVVNPDPARGMRSSLALAIDAATLAGADALAVMLVDVPGVHADAVRAVVSGWQPGRIAIGSYQGTRGHPTVMAPDLWRDALAVAGADEGARALLRSRPTLVDEIEVSGDPADLDTPEDMSRWTAG
jgi:CTP:molybdopterin cytidylyltransferase MocA